jgi:hypothetical protein
MPLPQPSEALNVAPAGPTPSRTSLQGTLARMRARLGTHVLVVGGLCLAIAVILTLLDGNFPKKLLYSLCIGVACTTIVDLTRLAEAWLSDRLRQSRGLPPFDDLNGWRGALPGSVLAVLLGPGAGVWLVELFTRQPAESMLNLGSSSTRIIIAFSVLGTVFAVVVISTMERLSAARAQAEAAQRLAAENQLRLLQSQLEPHMIFNTLANLRVLIGLEPARAQAMLDHLIHFLRATLNASRTEAHPLATEFDRIADYLTLMGVRMGPRLQVQLDLPDALRALPVPPLLLQPLVENAIKHGLEPHVQGGRVTVSARADGAYLVLDVRDTGAGLGRDPAATAGTQFGLSQVRQRLSTLYGQAATLTLQAASDAAGGTLASVRLPTLDPAPPKTP